MCGVQSSRVVPHLKGRSRAIASAIAQISAVRVRGASVATGYILSRGYTHKALLNVGFSLADLAPYVTE